MLDENPASVGEPEKRLTSVELCAGGGGLALGLEQAGFDPVLLLDNFDAACETLRVNRPSWNVLEMDVHHFVPGNHQEVHDVDLLAGGLPRLQSAATGQRVLGNHDELAILRKTLEITGEIRPRALLIENIPDLANKPKYASVRDEIDAELDRLGYGHEWFVLNAADHGVPQHREQGILVAFKDDGIGAFQRPSPMSGFPPTVGEVLKASMARNGWPLADQWAAQATDIAPTLVGGSGNRGGPDLGPSGTKRAWERMGVYGGSFANAEPGRNFDWDPARGPKGMVPLTLDQAALLQGFPADWHFAGGKTKRYRQIGNASPPPVGKALGVAVRAALESA